MSECKSMMFQTTVAAKQFLRFSLHPKHEIQETQTTFNLKTSTKDHHPLEKSANLYNIWKPSGCMNVSSHVQCTDFPCTDMSTAQYTVPHIDINQKMVKMFMISEAPPQEAGDYFYASNTPSYVQTTLQVFNQAGASVSSMKDILNLGVYITTAVKCGKVGYSISAKTIDNCSRLLENEIALFPNVKVFMLMGDVAIKALNYIAKRQIGKRVIPSGSTYKIRKNEYSYKGLRVFPSYLQTGKSFLIEKSKQKMIAEDIKNALSIL